MKTQTRAHMLILSVLISASPCALAAISTARNNPESQHETTPPGDQIREETHRCVQDIEATLTTANQPSTVKPDDEYVLALHLILISSDDETSALRSLPSYQGDILRLLELSLDLNFQTPVSLTHLFRAAQWLPASARLSSIIYRAFEHPSGADAAAWNNAVVDKIGIAEMNQLRQGIRAHNPEQQLAHQLVALAIRGTPEDFATLRAALNRALLAERLAPLAQGIRSDDIASLIELETINGARSPLWDWALSDQNLSFGPRVSWAMNRSLMVHDERSPDFEQFWGMLDQRIQIKLDQMEYEASCDVTKHWTRNTRTMLQANMLTPWINWAEQHHVVVPDTLQRKAPKEYRDGLGSFTFN